tara:strand:- start:101 stop:973 length:873 start_codon:yes stop_codon:yes gene_type:complete
MKTFTLNKEYKKTDIYKILNVPKDRQGGSWRKGHHNYKVKDKEDLHFIFANIDMPGHGFDELEFNYDNRINDSGELEWVTEDKYPQDSPTIISLLENKTHIFIRTSKTQKDYWQYFGEGKIISVDGNNPVKIKWDIKKEAIVRFLKQRFKKEDENEAIIRRNAVITGSEAEKEFEKYAIETLGWRVKNMTNKTGFGYDFLCTDNNEKELYVEVKGSRKGVENIRLTETEWNMAKKYPEKYILSIVTHLDAALPKFIFIENVFDSFKDVVKSSSFEYTSLQIRKKDIEANL